jgi:hypothetical protein
MFKKPLSDLGEMHIHIKSWESKSKNAIYCMIPIIWHMGKAKCGDSTLYYQWLPVSRGEG